MIRQATLTDRERVIEVLSASFEANPAVNDTISPGGSREKKMRALMEYLVDTGYAKQGVYITKDLLGAFILYNPIEYPNTLSDTWRQLRLVNRCIGWSRLKYASSKDKKMKSFRPADSHLYLNMIGTHPSAQGKGIGSLMLNYIFALSAESSKSIYLETSVLSNVEMYKRRNFVVHGDWKIREDYHVHFMSWSK
jgi:ribosomal protein S18 acetylase RimI-like enzyme